MPDFAIWHYLWTRGLATAKGSDQMTTGSGFQSVLYTPVLQVETANTTNMTVTFYILNASSAARNGTLQIFAGDGTSLSTTSYHNLQPGGVSGDEVSRFHNVARVTLVYGRITVDDRPEAIRASLSLRDSTGNTWVSVNAR